MIEYFIKLSKELPLRVRPYYNKYSLIAKVNGAYYRIDSGDYEDLKPILRNLVSNHYENMPSWAGDVEDFTKRFCSFKQL